MVAGKLKTFDADREHPVVEDLLRFRCRRPPVGAFQHYGDKSTLRHRNGPSAKRSSATPSDLLEHDGIICVGHGGQERPFRQDSRRDIVVSKTRPRFRPAKEYAFAAELKSRELEESHRRADPSSNGSRLLFFP